MRKLLSEIQKKQLLLCAALLIFSCLPAVAQSINPDYPTPVTSNEISGIIKARDIGDSRLTSFYYVFNGNQGDIFINIETRNLNGDIDVFAAEGLRPLSKIRLYADNSEAETGRIVYLRKPDKLILRIEGTTPDDNPASFKIKFAGSFLAYEPGTQTGEPALPKVETADNGGVKVNSVGTIIAEGKPDSIDDRDRIAEKQADSAAQSTATAAETLPKTAAADDSSGEDSDNKAATSSKSEKSDTESVKTPLRKNRKTAGNKPAKPSAPPADENTETPTANPLENIRLVVLMKDGAKIEYPMTEVFRFSLNNNVLTIILKDGKIERRSILEIQKFSVE